MLETIDTQRERERARKREAFILSKNSSERWGRAEQIRDCVHSERSVEFEQSSVLERID